MNEKPYAGLMVTLLNREDGTERKVMLYPAVRVEFGNAASLAAAKRAIDEWYEEQA